MSISVNPHLGSRPDGVIWPYSAKTVIWIELTCPWEDNMTLRHHEKISRYNQLKINCESNGWRVRSLCVGVGCRGHCGQAYEWMCKVLGFSKQEEKDVKFCVEETVQHCICAIRCTNEYLMCSVVVNLLRLMLSQITDVKEQKRDYPRRSKKQDQVEWRRNC